MAGKERIEKLLQVLQTDPNDSFARYGLALEYIGTGEKENAVVELRRLLVNDPDYIPAYHQLGRVLGSLNQTKEAKEIYRKGIDHADSLGEDHERDEMEEELEDLEDEW